MPGRDHQFEQDYMVPKSEGDVSNLLVLHALRTTSDALKRIGDQQDRHSNKIGDVLKGVHQLDTRMAVMEANTLAAQVAELKEDVDKLKEKEQQRVGAIGFADWVSKSWPAILAFIGLVVYVILNESGRL